MSATSLVITAVLGAALAATLASLFLATPASWADGWLTFHLFIAVTSVQSCLHIGAAILFLLSIGVYKARLRYAYTMISVGIVLLAIGALQLPIIHAFDLWDTVWVTGGIIGIPFTLSGLAMYIGARGLARLIGIKTIYSRASIVVPIILVVCVLSTFLPHVTSPLPEMAFDMTNIILLWSGLLNLAAAFAVLAVARSTGVYYQSSMAWLAVSLMISSLILLLVVVRGLTTTSTQDVLTDVLSVLGGALFMKAGYEFSKTKNL